MKLNLAMVILTCPGREAMLAQTRLALDQTDFMAAEHDAFRGSVCVQLDTNTCARRQERQERNSLAALAYALEFNPLADFILFCEDDIVFNARLRWNLENWWPLWHYPDRRAVTPGQPPPSPRKIFFGSLYDPNIRELSVNQRRNYFIADPGSVYGSQCFVLSREMAEYCVAHWWEETGMQDIKMSRLAGRSGPIYYHWPSLVQHVGEKSTWTEDSRFHQTKTFNPRFVAEPLI